MEISVGKVHRGKCRSHYAQTVRVCVRAWTERPFTEHDKHALDQSNGLLKIS